jgi:glycosyltransferase involved in cell wall biosynthesis
MTSFKLWRHRQALLRQQSEFLALCDAIISVSPPIVSALRDEGRRSSSIVTLLRNTPPLSPTHPQPLRLLHNSLGLPDNARIALYQGFIEPNKGLSEIVSQLPQWESTPWVFVMMGPIQDQPFFDGLIRSAPPGRCFYHPAVYGPELDAYTTSADLGIITIPPVHLSYRWCLPNKLFSYIQGELPMVCLTVLEECAALVNQYKIGLSIDRVQDLTRQLHDWQDDPPELLTARLNEWRQACQQAKQTLNWETEQHALLRLYERLLSQTTSPESNADKEESPLSTASS